MKDGSKLAGYINSSSSGTLDIDDFLINWTAGSQSLVSTKFDFYPGIYNFQESQYYHGFAFCREELQWVDAKQVVKMVPLPTSKEVREFGVASILAKDEIDFLRNHTVYCTDHVEDRVSNSIFTAFNCDPAINKKELHRILLKYIKAYGNWEYKNKPPWDDEALKKKMGWEKIHFVFDGYVVDYDGSGG